MARLLQARPKPYCWEYDGNQELPADQQGVVWYRTMSLAEAPEMQGRAGALSSDADRMDEHVSFCRDVIERYAVRLTLGHRGEGGCVEDPATIYEELQDEWPRVVEVVSSIVYGRISEIDRRFFGSGCTGGRASGAS